MNQITALKIIVEKCVKKDGKLFASLMDLDQAADRIEKKGLWNA